MSEWTSGRLRSFITSTLRGGFRKYPIKYECLQKACVGKKVNVKTNRLSAHYECNICKEHVPTSEIQVDHIKPIVDPVTGFTTWDSFIENLFCEEDNLQAVCKPCHDIKTKAENTVRKKSKNDSN